MLFESTIGRLNFYEKILRSTIHSESGVSYGNGGISRIFPKQIPVIDDATAAGLEKERVLQVPGMGKKGCADDSAGFSALEKRKCQEEGQRRRNSRFFAATRLLDARTKEGRHRRRDNSREWLWPLPLPRNYCPANDRYRADDEIARRSWTDRFRRRERINGSLVLTFLGSSDRQSVGGTRWRTEKPRGGKTRASFGIVGGNGAVAAPVRGNSLPGSRVSLVCNVCSRLLPKEWFAERPMASARANSRVPQPRHLCIIMLRPPLLPRTPQAAPTTEEKSVSPFPPCPTRHRRTLLRVPPRPRQPPPSTPPPPPPPPPPSSPPPSPSTLARAFSLPSCRCTPIRQRREEKRREETASGWGTVARRRNGARENERRRKTDGRRQRGMGGR
ncbi:hypothetical protein K0M31_018054 [Melipona bicolor]|uniref:Uncharacterized protein n=1 Tax=Melipona bicolor TaxID=60889 RepID=A0AA40KE62_9HYME|nr:hypothetical protein K0M31_018054 [Melipona bicolor]